MSGVYEAQFLTLVAVFLPVGIATKTFLFTPSTASKRDVQDERNELFDPQTATLKETLWYNVWGFSHVERVFISRTGTLVAVTFLYSWLQVYASVEGAESVGAAGWAVVWATAAWLTGLAYSWVGDVEGVKG